MSNFKKDIKVLVDCWHNKFPGEQTTPIPGGIIHPHPGVPVADLVRIAELADKTSDTNGTGQDWHELCDLLRAFRAAREAAQEPKLQEGQEIVLHATVTGFKDGYYLVDIPSRYISTAHVHPDDIRTEEPTGVDQ